MCTPFTVPSPVRSLSLVLFMLGGLLAPASALPQQESDGGTGLVNRVGSGQEPPEGTDSLNQLREALEGTGALEDVQRDWPGLEQQGPPAWAGPPPSGWKLFADSSFEAIFDGDVDDSDNELNSTRFGAGGGWQRHKPGGGFERFRYGYEFTKYDFSGPSLLAGGSPNPIEDVIQNELSYTIVTPLKDRNLGFAGIVNIRAGMEDDADFFDSLSYQLIGGVRVRANENLIWNFGSLVQFDLSGDVTVVPIIGIDWEIRDGLRIRTPGPGLEIEADLSRTTRAYFSARYENRNYRAGTEGPQLLSDGSIEDELVALRLGMRFNWSSKTGGFPNRRLDLYVGAVPYREIGFFGEDDQRLAEVEIDPASLVGLSFQFGF